MNKEKTVALPVRQKGVVVESAFKVLAYFFLFVLAGFVAAVIIACIMFVINSGVFLHPLFSEEIRFSLRLTLITVTSSTALAMLFSIPAAYALSKYRIPLSGLVDTLIDLPIVLPPVAAGICLLVLFGYYLGDGLERWGMTLAYTQRGIVVAQFFCTVTFSTRTVKAAFDSINPRLTDVARTLGSNEWRTFLRITLPLARNGILAGGIISWARCLGLFGPVMMFCGATRFRTEILPTSIYLQNSIGEIEGALATTLLLLIIALITLILFKRLGGRGYLW
ncbi:MAG: ABC transporter permease subunit [Candidatus Omnitrophica bacterium]|nr:ABC transporter permease subunit [Candidatus Omnitrophota bacterium]